MPPCSRFVDSARRACHAASAHPASTMNTLLPLQPRFFAALGFKLLVCALALAFRVDAAQAAPVVAGGTPAGPGAKKILIVTGLDYPGHKWQLTTPVLRDAVGKDQRMQVTVTEDARVLASPELKEYDVILLNYMNWENPGPGKEAQEGLRKAVEAGTGLVMVHFSCGAFQDWPEFVKVAGRVWDPKLRPHDPLGSFKVEIRDKTHPVTAGMEDFETVDELYTCLTGDAAIKVLASARSMVDHKDYPMAFAFEYGKGKVFQSVLGHDVKALEPEAVRKLFRRACAWAAGLEPNE